MSNGNSYDVLEPERVHTKEETDKKCPACGGTMDFDPATGGLLCPFCGNKLEIDAAGKQTAAELDFASAERTENCDWGVEKKTVICKSCGAETVYDALEIAGECPYCGSNQVMEEKGRDTLAPGGVCPFKIDRKQAGGNFMSWIKKKLFCPRAAKQKAKPEAFKGVYLPYWTFDADTYSDYTARYGIDRQERGSDGKTRTETDWYNTSGEYHELVDDQLVIGTTRQDERMLSRIEPFSTADNVAYKPEYIAGFASERYSVGLRAAWEKAKEFIKKRLFTAIKNKVKRDHHADRVDSVRFTTTYANVTYKYLLLPVWISSFRYGDKIYRFMVNGQTGKVGGRAPVSPLRVAIAVALGIAVIVGAVLLYQYFGR